MRHTGAARRLSESTLTKHTRSSDKLNGVFKGGGAKGVVYAGALAAVDERGLRFASVAGSSAGAITAALVAAQLSSTELRSEAAEGLKRVKGRFLRGFLPFSSGGALFSVNRLESWLEDLLQRKVGGTGSSDGSVTFDELQEASGIELNVVAMDLDRRQPVVFNATTAGSCSVAKAVLASCAIPVAMPPGRLEVQTERGSEVHRLVDGGAWANYPMFVYSDRSFREYHELADPDPQATTVGFVIDPPRLSRSSRGRPHAMLGRRRSDVDLGSGPRTGTLGALLNSRFLRFLMVCVIPLISAFVFFDWLWLELNEFFPSFEPLPGWAEPLALVTFVGFLGVFVIVAAAMATGLLRFGHEVFDVGLPALVASVSVGPRTPDWVGQATGDHVVRLSVPEGITTTKFRLDNATTEQAIDYAHFEACVALNLIFPDRAQPLPPKPEPLSRASGGFRPRLPKRISPRLAFAVLLFLLVPWTAGFTVLFLDFVTERAWSMAIFLMFIIAVLVLLGLVSGALVRSSELARGHRPAGLAAAIGGVAVTVALVIGLAPWLLPSQGPVSRLANTEAIDGRVLKKSVASTRGPLATHLYDVELVRPISNARFREKSSAVSYCGTPPRATCITFNSPAQLSSGETTTVLLVTETGAVVLESKAWFTTGAPRTFFLLGILAVLVTYAWWAIRRLRPHMPTFGGDA